jgi:homoserine dehydrogenase
MRGSPLIVLKFGGSVLIDESTLRLAVHEIYRWRRQNHRVVAVVSALAGVTDELLRRCARVGGPPAPASVAALVSTGELQSAALLALHLGRAGLSATVLTPGAITLVAIGPALDASPIDVNAAPLERALARDGVVVIPGYVAQDADGRTCVLGRGGSDLTALFLAHRLQADCCRLVKDVDGLYERDPAEPGPPPRRYAVASWSDALATDGTIVQHKAVRFAAAYALEFELGRLNDGVPTRIGPGPTAFHPATRGTAVATGGRGRRPAG